MSGPRKRKEKKPLIKRKGLWIFLAFLIVLSAGAAFYAWDRLLPFYEQSESYDLVDIDKVKDPSRILDRNGGEFARMFVENRDQIPITEVPQIFIDALLAQEDQRFFVHDGVDWIGVVRAAYLNAKSGGVTQGAGTITMQLARNAFDLLGEARRKEQRGVERKIVEAFLALRIEKELGNTPEMVKAFPDPEARKKAMKTRLLEFYLNRVPFGGGYYGVRAASLGYFGKEPQELNLAECASIVACVKNPTAINPVRHPVRNKKDRDHVLRRMALEGMITEEEKTRLTSLPVETSPDPILRGKSYLYEKIERLARDIVGEEAMAEGGFTIETSIDYELQQQAEERLRDELNLIERRSDYQHAKYEDYQRDKRGPRYLQGAALTIDNDSGEVLVHVGGRDYSHSQYDFIELGRRPLGTAAFPFINAAAWDRGMTPASEVLDAPMNNRQLMVGGIEGIVGEWGMEVTNPTYAQRDITARQALVNSKIAAMVRLGTKVGLKTWMGAMQDFGFQFSKEKLLPRNLVGWNAASVPETVNAYAAFARGGRGFRTLRYLRKITDSHGEVLYQAPTSVPDAAKRACSPETAYQVHTVLNDVLQTGNLSEEARQLSGGNFPGGVKTGTPYNFTDAWTAGYTRKITSAVWVGFHQGSRRAIVSNGFARTLSLPIWTGMMNASRNKYPDEEIPRPKSVVTRTCCRDSGQKPTLYCNEVIENASTGEVSFRSTSYQEFFKKGIKLGICSVHGAGVDAGLYAQGKPPRKALPVVPIKSKAPLLIGSDPYNSEKPSLAPEDINADKEAVFNDDTLVVEDSVRGEREALLQLPRPPRFELPVLSE